MTFRSIGINLTGDYLSGEQELARSLEVLEAAGPDFVEVCPHNLGVILGGRLVQERMEAVAKVLEKAELGYTVHAPHGMNLMDLSSREVHRGALESSVRFAAEIGARIVVCHAGQRSNARDARYSLKDQLDAQRSALWRVGEVAARLGGMIAVENSYPEPPVLQGRNYAPAARPSELAGQVAATDHPSVGVCLDVGHAHVAASAFGFDYLKECAAAAPLVRHVHLHDNLGLPDPDGETRIGERHAYGIGDLHLPPGQGSIPLEDLFRTADFARDITCCVELSPGLRHSAGEALKAARRLEASVGAPAR